MEKFYERFDMFNIGNAHEDAQGKNYTITEGKQNLYFPMIMVLKEKGYALDDFSTKCNITSDVDDNDTDVSIYLTFEEYEQLPSIPVGFEIDSMDSPNQLNVHFDLWDDMNVMERQNQYLQALLRLNQWIQDLPDRRAHASKIENSESCKLVCSAKWGTLLKNLNVYL